VSELKRKRLVGSFSHSGELSRGEEAHRHGQLELHKRQALKIKSKYQGTQEGQPGLTGPKILHLACVQFRRFLVHGGPGSGDRLGWLSGGGVPISLGGRVAVILPLFFGEEGNSVGVDETKERRNPANCPQKSSSSLCEGQLVLRPIWCPGAGKRQVGAGLGLGLGVVGWHPAGS